jgi:hypothetical protein
MPSKSGDVVLINCALRPGRGCFARSKRMCEGRYFINHWYFCREIFHGLLHELDIFFFSHQKFQTDNVVAFMSILEEKLDVTPRSVFGPTQRKTIMYVKPSRWWLRLAMRRSIFTIFLRAGLNYERKKDNFLDAMLREVYLKHTWPAVKRFLSGYTVYTGKKRGWHKQFSEKGLTKKDIQKLLVRPQN